MSGIASENLSLLEMRWPTLAQRVVEAPPPASLQWNSPAGQPVLEVEGHRLWSAFDAESEARMQAETIPTGSTQAWIYGVGGGDLIREVLRRDEIRRLHVVILNAGLFHVLLHSLDHRDWLADSRVELQDGAVQKGPAFPFAAVPACLALCAEDNGALRDQLTDEILLPFERERQKRREPRRRRQMEQNLALLVSDGDVAELFGRATGATAHLAIAGPTLEQTASWIRENRGGGTLVAVDGALIPLLKAGLVPDIVVSIDDNRDTILRYFSYDLSDCADSTLVYSPLVHNDVLVRWPGRRLTTYTFEPIYDELRNAHPKAELYVAGSVSHPAVDLALKMGVGQVMLFGADFGFPDGKIHANANAPTVFYANAAKAGATAVNGHGELIPTMASFNGYRIGLERLIGLHPEVDFVNTSRNGARIAGTRYLDGIDG